MKYLLCMVAALALYLLFYYARIAHVTKEAKNSPIRHSDQRLGSGPSLHYIAAGDSTAVGVGASAPANAYADKIAARLAEKNEVFYRNIGVSGAQTKDVIESQLQQIVDYRPDLITVSIGANDITHLLASDVILENYKKIISRLINETGAQIYITDIPNFKGAALLPWAYIQLLEYRSAKINPRILDMENSRVHIINIHDFGWHQFPDPKAVYASDYFHPNDTGYQNWTNAFLDKITPKK